MTGFAIKTQDGRYYNGRAAKWDGNLTANKSEAFAYNTYDNAYRKVEFFNQCTRIHGFYFEVEEI